MASERRELEKLKHRAEQLHIQAEAAARRAKFHMEDAELKRAQAVAVIEEFRVALLKAQAASLEWKPCGACDLCLQGDERRCRS